MRIRREGLCDDGRSESEIQKEALEWLQDDSRVAIAFRFDSDRKRARKYAKGAQHGKGIPDVHGMLRGGKYFCIEFKKPGGRVSPEQIEFLAKVKNAFGFSLLAFSVEDVKHWIESIYPKK